MKYSELKKQNKKMKKKIERLKEDQAFLEGLMTIASNTHRSIMSHQQTEIVSLRNKVYEKTAERNALKTIFKEEIIENYEKEKEQ